MTKDGIRNAIVVVALFLMVGVGLSALYGDSQEDKRNECLRNVAERYTTDITDRTPISVCSELSREERIEIAELVQSVGKVNGGIQGEAHG